MSFVPFPSGKLPKEKPLEKTTFPENENKSGEYIPKPILKEHFPKKGMWKN